MAIDNQTFKFIGMWRDNSESAQDNKYAFENFNMRIEARDGNTQLGLENERGNEKIDIAGKKINQLYSDEQASIVNGLLEIRGTPIGYCQIGDDLLLFTTETECINDEELAEYNEQTQFVTNKRNLFTLSSARLESVTPGNVTLLKVFIGLQEYSEWQHLLDDVQVTLKVSELEGDASTSGFIVGNYSTAGQKSAEPVFGGANFNFTIPKRVSGEYLYMHSLEFTLAGKTQKLAIVDIRNLIDISNPRRELLGSPVVFPQYSSGQDNILTGFTTVGSYADPAYKLDVIGGDFIVNGNLITFNPHVGYKNKIQHVFKQSVNGGALLGLIPGNGVAMVGDSSVSFTPASKGGEIVVLERDSSGGGGGGGNEPPVPPAGNITNLTCSPASAFVKEGDSISITVNHIPASVPCTITYNIAADYVSHISTQGSRYTFVISSFGEADEQTISFSCTQNPALSAACTVHKEDTKVVDTPISHVFSDEDSEEIGIHINTTNHDASDFSAQFNGYPLCVSNESEPVGGEFNNFIYSVMGFTDSTGVMGHDVDLYISCRALPMWIYERVGTLQIFVKSTGALIFTMQITQQSI